MPKIHYISSGYSDFPVCGGGNATARTSETLTDVDCGNCKRHHIYVDDVRIADESLNKAAQPRTDNPFEVLENIDLDREPTAESARAEMSYGAFLIAKYPVSLDAGGCYDHTNAPALCDGCDKVRMVRSDDGRTLLCRDCRRTVRLSARKPHAPRTAMHGKDRRPRGSGETRKYRRQYMSARKHRDRAGNKHHRVHVPVGSAPVIYPTQRLEDLGWERV